MNGEHSCAADAKSLACVPRARGKFSCELQRRKAAGLRNRGIHYTGSDKYYADVWLVRCKNDNYVRNQTCAKYSATVGPGFDSKFHSFYKLSRWRQVLAVSCIFRAATKNVI